MSVELRTECFVQGVENKFLAFIFSSSFLCSSCALDSCNISVHVKQWRSESLPHSLTLLWLLSTSGVSGCIGYIIRIRLCDKGF